MKNHEEFRATVFEKAKKYEAQRKARNKKITEIACLSSLVLVITLTAYLGIIPSLPTDIEKFETTPSEAQTTAAELSEKTKCSEISETSVMTTTAMTEQTEHTQTDEKSDTIPAVESTAADEATTIAETTTAVQSTTTAETTTALETTTIVEATTEMIETQIRPPLFHLDFRDTAENHHSEQAIIELSEIKSYPMWETFLAENASDYPTLTSENMTDMTEEYFEENLLVILEYVGYDLMYVAPYEENDGKYSLSVTFSENSENTAKQIQIISVSKDAYWNTNFVF